MELMLDYDTTIKTMSLIRLKSVALKKEPKT